MFHTGHSNECLQRNALDLSVRVRNLGYSVASYPSGSGSSPAAGGLDDISHLDAAGCGSLGEDVYPKPGLAGARGGGATPRRTS